MMPAVVFWISSTEPPPPPSHQSEDHKAKTTLRTSQSGLGAIQGRGTLGGSSLGLTVMYFLCGCQPVAYPSSSLSAALALTPLSTNTTPPQKSVFLLSAPPRPLCPCRPTAASFFLSLIPSTSFLGEQSLPTGWAIGDVLYYCKFDTTAIILQQRLSFHRLD